MRSLLAILAIPHLAMATPLFVDRAPTSGVDFVHFNGMTGQTYFPEMMGAGAGLLDYDGDGDLDLYLVQGELLGPGRTLEQAMFPPRHPLPLGDRLYRNDSSDGQLRFTDVTGAAGIPPGGYGMGVSVGDVNNDGWPDLYLSNYGPNRLLINQGDGTFADRTEAWGAEDSRWSVTGVLFDYDGDGFQDLYVVNYVDYTFENIKVCRSHYDAPDYCSPQSYRPVADRLFRNRNGSGFDNATARTGIAAQSGPGLGAVAGDFNGDGRQDLYVANDGAANFLWINQGDRFVDDALLAGVAVNMSGTPEASMGVDAGDFDGDGDLDLFLTHLNRQTNTLYVNDGQGWFMDGTGASGLGASSFPFTGFGTLWFDYDNDGWLDLLSANGAVVKIEQQDLAGDPFPLKQANQLFRNTGKGGYEDVSALAGPDLVRLRVSRGAAFGDIDNDGDTDVVITNNAGPAELLINQVGQDASWIGFRLLDPAGRVDQLGARVSVKAGERTLAGRVRTDGSYVSAQDPRVLIGLGSHRDPVQVEIRWPDGARQTLATLQPGRYHTIRRGEAP